MTIPVSSEAARDAVAAAITTVVPYADLDTLPAGAVLRDELELDSLDFLTFVETLAARTGREIPESDYERLRSLDSCVAYLSAD